jgi:putative transposase
MNQRVLYHTERNHQGKGNVILFPKGQPHLQSDQSSGRILKHERLGGLLKYHHREAA